MKFDGTSAPQLIVEVAFTVDPGVDASATSYFVLDSSQLNTGQLSPSPNWVDITEDSIEVHYSRGRQNETDVVDIGQAKILLDNSSAQYDPDNTGSPYYVGGVGTSVLPMRQVRVRAIYDDVSYTLYRGYIEDYEFDFGGTGQVLLDCVDSLALFGQLKLATLGSPSFNGDTTGARINRLANLVGWPASLRNIDTGQTVMCATNYGDTALSLAQKAQTAEVGIMFVDGTGELCFRDRYSLYNNPRSSTVQCTFADDGNAYPEYLELKPVYGVNGMLYNIVTLSRSDPTGGGGITPVSVEDSDSVDIYGSRTWPNTDTIDVQTDLDLQDYCEYLLARYKDPALRVKSLKVEVLNQPQFFPQFAALDLWDRINVQRTYGSSYTFSQDLWLEGVQVDITEESWEITYSTSRVSTSLGRPFVLNSSHLDTDFVGY